MKQPWIGLATAALVVTLSACATPEPPTAEPPTAMPPATEAQPAAPPTAAAAGDTYTHPEGYTVTLPPSWTGKYTVADMPAADRTALMPMATSATQFLYTPTDPANTPEPLLTLSTFTSADWDAMSAEEGPPVGTKVGEFGDGMVLVATTPQSSPYTQGTADQVAFDALYADLDLGTLMAEGGAATGAGEAMAEETPEMQPAATPEPGSALEPAVLLPPLPEGTEPEAGQPVEVPVMAADPDGLAKVELQLNGVTVANIDWADAQKFFEGNMSWVPQEAGTYELAAVATDPEGHKSELAKQTVVVKAAPTAAAGQPAPPRPTAPPKPTASAPAADSSPPSVSIEPAKKNIQPGEKMSIYTNAIHPTGIVRLELRVGDQTRAVWVYEGPAGEAPKSAFQTLTWPNAKEGQYDVWVKAFTGGGGTGQSVKERVHVKPQ
jgi:hypothetical protein